MKVDGQTFLVGEVAKTVEAELKRLGAAEGIEIRVLLDESLKTEIEGLRVLGGVRAFGLHQYIAYLY